ncbi:hypothetical protein [Aeromonas dhakensis]|uniref:hypothetical protein n=1 Tax=Aeromonas dhakensis TaxID=196024 RepID=UPI001F4F40B4|nr:hypothetical protein [Aeromonas dhakensis]
MYELTQGVMDIVVKLFALAQIRAIVTGAEHIKPPLLRKVFEDEFKPVHPMLAALRSGRAELIAKYDDLLMPEIEGRLISLSRSLDRAVPLKPPSPPVDDKAKKLAALLEAMEIPKDIAMPMADELMADHPSLPLATLVHKATAYLAQEKPKVSTISKVKRAEWGRLPQSDLRRLYADGPESSAYDSFKKAGLVFDLQSLLGKAG